MPALIRSLMFLLVMLPAQLAFAQSDAEKAADLYKSGVDLYFAEDFGLAITKFRAGYELDPNPMFLYSLSLCFSKLQNYEQALGHAQRAKQAGGMEPDVALKNDARLASFAIIISAGDTVNQIVAAANAPKPSTCRINKDCDEGMICNIGTGACVVEDQTFDDSTPLFGPVGWAGVGATAVGIGLLVGGGVTSVAVSKNTDRLDDSTLSATERDELTAKIDRQKSLGRILILGGGGLAIVGAGLVVVDLLVLGKRDEEPSAGFTPIIVPGGAGIGWAATF